MISFVKGRKGKEIGKKWNKDERVFTEMKKKNEWRNFREKRTIEKSSAVEMKKEKWRRSR